MKLNYNDKLKEYALSKNCIDFDDLLNEVSEEEVKEIIDKTYKCLFDGGYFNKEETTYKLDADYIEVYVNDEFEGKYYMVYDRELGVNRLYDAE